LIRYIHNSSFLVFLTCIPGYFSWILDRTEFNWCVFYGNPLNYPFLVALWDSISIFFLVLIGFISWMFTFYFFSTFSSYFYKEFIFISKGCYYCSSFYSKGWANLFNLASLCFLLLSASVIYGVLELLPSL